MRKYVVISMLALAMVMMMVGMAFAHGSTYAVDTVTPDKTAPGSLGCTDCHPSDTAKQVAGPHGGYTATSNKCALCHTVHAAGNTSLLPGATLTAACQFCHDLTATKFAPYNMSGGAAVKGAHRVVGIDFKGTWTMKNMGTKGNETHGNVYSNELDMLAGNDVPGANDVDGKNGNITGNAGGGSLSGNLFTCDSCHTPHAMPGSTVDPYLGESLVKQSTTYRVSGVTYNMAAGEAKLFLANRLLRKSINGVDATEYGSAWCGTCHKGRDNHVGMSVYNHPVDMTANFDLFQLYDGDVLDAAGTPGAAKAGAKVAEGTTGAYYVVVDSDPTTGYLTGNPGSFAVDPRSNKYFAMTGTDPLTLGAFDDGNVAYAAGDGPSCQQCHNSARIVADSWATTGKPARMNFPHVSTNKALLVETGDDFCTNCHGLTLP